MARPSKYKRTTPRTPAPPTVAGLLGVPDELLAQGLGLLQKVNPPAAHTLTAGMQFVNLAAAQLTRIAAELKKARQDPGYVVPDESQVIELKQQKDGSYK
mgnify:CR=1 FL=1